NDNNRIFEFTYKTLRALIAEMGDKNPWLQAIAEGREYVDDYSQSAGLTVRPFDLNPDLKIDLDGELLVVNEYWLERRKIVRVFDSLSGTYRGEIPEDQRKEWT